MTFRWRNEAFLILVIGALAFIVGALSSCERNQTQWQPSPIPSPVTSSASPQASASPSVSSSSCETVPSVEIMRNRKPKELKLPASGNFAEESHIMTDQESYPGLNGFPTTRQEGMEAHIKLHCPILAKYGLDCESVYSKADLTMMRVHGAPDQKLPYKRVWTGANDKGQYAGGWSRKRRPTIEQETWIVNLAWDFDFMEREVFQRIYVVCAEKNGKCVRVFAGENGPSDTKWLGGYQPAVAAALGVKNTDKVRIARAKSQEPVLGPITCP